MELSIRLSLRISGIGSHLVGSAPTWDRTGCEFNSWQCWIYIPCSLSLRSLWSLQDSLGTYGSTQKLCWKKLSRREIPDMASEIETSGNINLIPHRRFKWRKHFFNWAAPTTSQSCIFSNNNYFLNEAYVATTHLDPPVVCLAVPTSVSIPCPWPSPVLSEQLHNPFQHRESSEIQIIPTLIHVSGTELNYGTKAEIQEKVSRFHNL